MIRWAAASCTFVLAACGSSPTPKAVPQKSSRPSSASAFPSSPMPTGVPSASVPGMERTRFSKPYLNAFEDFLVAYTRADEHSDPASIDLDRFATGPALAWARKQVADHRKLGVAHRGTWHFRSVGAVDVTTGSAQVGQCMDWSSWPVVNRTTGVTFQRFSPWSQLVYAQMTLVHGQWKAASVRVQAAAC